MGRDRSDRPEVKPIRLFVAGVVPEAVKSVLEAHVTRFRQRVPAARWTQSDGWHVTLKFLGTTWPRLVDTVKEAVSTVAGETTAFSSALTHLGVFPSPGRTRVVWAGLSDPDGRFAAMAARLDELLAEEFTAEDRPFTPHLTLARLNPSRDIREFAPDLVGASVASQPFPVDHLVLFQSRLSPKGATYQAILEAPLAAD